MATVPVHIAAGVILSRALPWPWAIVATLASHALLDRYPECTTVQLGKPWPKGAGWFVATEIALMIFCAWFIGSHFTVATLVCAMVSVLPDAIEEIFQRVRGEDYDCPLFWCHSNGYQSNMALPPIPCAWLDFAIVTLILINEV